MDVEISTAKREEFGYIQEKIGKYALDGTDIEWKQFFVARLKERVVAFGRIIDHGESFEIATLGVDYYHRKNGFGKKMLNFLVQEAQRMSAQKPIYGVTHLPGFVKNCGFVPVEKDYPDYLEYKRKYKCQLDESRISIVKWTGESA